MLVPVILSGGAGTRLWPLSRELYPKQLLPLTSSATMLQDTVSRLFGLEKLGAPVVVCNESHRFMVAEQLRQIGAGAQTIMLEPVGRNTAPAVAVAALQALESDPDAVLLVLPADHVIADEVTFHRVVAAGHSLAERGGLITFGVVPTSAETGYGYIRAGRPLDGVDPATEISAFAVDCFVEKPDLATAEEYLASGDFFWNSGMFMFRASRYLEELEKFAPQMLEGCRRAFADGQRDLDFFRLGEEAFASCPGDSIDYAVMEKTAAAGVIPLDAGWSDVGSWSALWEVGEKDESGNVLVGDVLTRDVHNCYVHAGSRMVAAVGLEGHVVVETADAVLVAHRDQVQNVKAIVEKLKGSGREEAALHRRVNRPWGTYECVDHSGRFQVKRITVNPGASLSLQMHHHRAEHWVVVRGTARITRGEETFLLGENESTFIPLGVTHRLENPGNITLELIEIQSGSYLGEDDIVRFDDNYGR